MAACKACARPLVFELDPDDFNEATSSAAGGSPSLVPDDLELPCGCHFHWQCLFDTATQTIATLTCPGCHHPIATRPSPNDISRPQILTNYVNEGGAQPSLNIAPLLSEEAYLEAQPAARPARAYLTMCAEGDVTSIIELLQNLSSSGDDDDDDDDDDSNEEDDDDDADEERAPAPRMTPSALLRYQDPLDGMNSALHVAVRKQQADVVWLLLWLASNVSTSDFPTQARAAAAQLGAPRGVADSAEDPDIRTLRNEAGQTARVLAESVGGIMAELVRAGLL